MQFFSPTQVYGPRVTSSSCITKHSDWISTFSSGEYAEISSWRQASFQGRQGLLGAGQPNSTGRAWRCLTWWPGSRTGLDCPNFQKPDWLEPSKATTSLADGPEAACPPRSPSLPPRWRPADCGQPCTCHNLCSEPSLLGRGGRVHQLWENKSCHCGALGFPITLESLTKYLAQRRWVQKTVQREAERARMWM